MIEIASPATPQLSSLSPLVVRPRRPRSPKDAPSAYREYDCCEKHDHNADRGWFFATLRMPKSSSTTAPNVRRRWPARLKSP
jgi:hypothetical protein